MAFSAIPLKFDVEKLFDGRLSAKYCSNKECLNPNRVWDGKLLLGEFCPSKTELFGVAARCKFCINLKNRLKRADKIKKYYKFDDKGNLEKRLCARKECLNSNKDFEGFIPISAFGANENRKYGLNNYCKECAATLGEERRLQNPASYKNYQKKYYDKNPEKFKEKRKKYYDENREYFLIKNVLYQENNREKNKEYRLAHLKESSERSHQHYLKNKSTIRENQKQYEREKYASDIEFRLRKNLRSSLRTRIKRILGNKGLKKVSSIKDLGCSLSYLKTYLESKWQPGMSWDNYGKGHGKWNIDHIKALANFTLIDLDQQREAVHYTNLQPLWELDNIRKGNK